MLHQNIVLNQKKIDKIDLWKMLSKLTTSVRITGNSMH